MPAVEAGGGSIKPTDIVFDCPYCSKSLAIDYHGAGLTITCTDCGRDVEVPIPEGMELADFDSSEEEREIRILNLRRSLAVAEGRVTSLESRLDELLGENERLGELARELKERLDNFLPTVQRLMELNKDSGVILERLSAPSVEFNEPASPEGESAAEHHDLTGEADTRQPTD